MVFKDLMSTTVVKTVLNMLRLNMSSVAPGQELAMMEVEMPDPAAATAAGAEREPEPLMDRFEMLEAGVKEKKPEPLRDVGGDDRDVANIDRDEFVAMTNVTKRHSSGAVFMFRPAYVELHGKGLVDVPDLPGAGIFYHTSTRQWHAAWEGGNKAPSGLC